MPVYREDEFGRYPMPKDRPTPTHRREGDPVDLVKYYSAAVEWDPAKPRGGSMVMIARAAVTHHKLTGHGLNCIDNDHRMRQVRQALDALTPIELDWLAGAVNLAARFSRDRWISQQVRHSVKLDEDRHRHGWHDRTPEDFDQPVGWNPECPMCNPNDWRKYVYG